MELGTAHSSKFQHHNTCNLINPLDATRGGNSLWLSSQMFLAGGRPCQLLTSRGGRLPDRPKAAQAGGKGVAARDVAGDFAVGGAGGGGLFLFAVAPPEAEVQLRGGGFVGII